jgi:hypothetical protein
MRFYVSLSQENQMNGVAMNIKVEANGQMTLSNDRSMISIRPDGTIAISSLDSVQLTGACLAKLDNDRDCFSKGTKHVLAALEKKMK